MGTSTASIKFHPIHMRRTFALQVLGAWDPTACWNGDILTKSFSTSGGVCTVTVSSDAEQIHFHAEGATSDAVIHELTTAAALDDGYSQFAPSHPLLEKLRRQLPRLRLLRVPWLFDIACCTVLQQRVRYIDAVREWGRIAKGWGTPAPNDQMAFPSPEQWTQIASYDLIALGIDPQRARTLLALAKGCRSHPLRPDLTFQHLRLRLARIHGIGPWTTDSVLGFGAADPDAVPEGDLYLPHLVTYALTGAERGSDERMLELLEPYRPHRFRAIRLLYASRIKVPGWRMG